MAYQSRIQRTEKVSGPSSSGSMWGGALGALGGALLALPTGGLSVAAGASLGAGLGQAIGGSVLQDTQEVPVGGQQGYGVSYDQAMQAPQMALQPLPMESPAAYRARLDQVFKDEQNAQARSYG